MQKCPTHISKKEYKKTTIESRILESGQGVYNRLRRYISEEIFLPTFNKKKTEKKTMIAAHTRILSIT